MTVRDAEPVDIAALHRLSCDCFGVNAWAPHQLTPTPMRQVLIADGGGRCLGFSIIVTVADEGEIQVMAVVDACRRQGVGRALLDASCRAAASRGASTVYLEVRAANTDAQAFYRSFGFAVYGRRPGYYHAPDDDAVLMRLDV